MIQVPEDGRVPQRRCRIINRDLRAIDPRHRSARARLDKQKTRKEPDMSQNNGHPTSLRLKTGLAEMLKGGVIMDVTNAEQAAIAERAGAVAVMAVERVPAQIRAEGGVARMASP